MGCVPSRPKQRDRFEDLPEGILLHILSFLPTVFAVRTCVLSKRWKSLWKDVPNLEFDQCESKFSAIRFENFVDKVLQHRNSSTVNKFEFDCIDEDVDPHFISRWIDYVVRHSAQELCIQLPYIGGISCDTHDDCSLPSSLFTCDSVVEFKLLNPGDLMLPSLIRFSNLKILTFDCVTFVNDHLTNRLFSNCPVLEELMLNDCSWNCQSVHISCPRLSRLEIKQGPDYGISRACQIVIHGTSLKVFYYMGECEIECCLVSCIYLVEAYIDVRPAEETIDEHRQLEVTDRAHKLLQGLYNVPFLAISNETLQILNYKEDSFSQMPLFQNLTHLGVYKDPVDIQPHSGLLNFLRVCPSIDYLECMEGMFFGTDLDNLELPPFPVCLRTTLKRLLIHKCYGRMDEIYAVRVWLMIGRALEILGVDFLGGREELKQLCILVQDLPLSPVVRIWLHEPESSKSGSGAQKLDFGPFSVKFTDHWLCCKTI